MKENFELEQANGTMSYAEKLEERMLVKKEDSPAEDKPEVVDG